MRYINKRFIIMSFGTTYNSIYHTPTKESQENLLGNADVEKIVVTQEYKQTKPYEVVQYVHSWAELMNRMLDNRCVRIKVIDLYMKNISSVAVSADKADKDWDSISEGARTDDARISNNKFFKKVKEHKANNYSGANVDEVNARAMAMVVWQRFGEEYVNTNIITPCYTQKRPDSVAKGKSNGNTVPGYTSGPFDMRLARWEIDSNDKAAIIMPYNIGFADVATSGYIIGKDEINKLAASAENDKFRELRQTQYDQMVKDNFYKGVQALHNTYALIRLYGSNGGQYLVNEKGKRKWYEIDQTSDNFVANFSSIPTTSALISWGNGDPHGRTPYHFTDFVFAKYWKKIENNRLITLRRYAAPILDNLKFPGMGGYSGGTEGTTTKEIPFPPMATAITYFGGETGNSLNSILKFSTGVNWEDAQASVWEVNAMSTPDSQAGPGKLYGELTRFAEMLNVAGGNFDRELVQNAGALPPDPYNNGPYENRIMGPINRIDSVKKRKPGLSFSWEGLNLVFEYVARPVGGVNPKAALLDIMSNFLVMGSASAVFFGGAHRFMTDPAKYPFLGGDRGIEKWYKGDPVGWGTLALEDLTEKTQVAGSGFWQNALTFFNNLMGGEGGAKIFGGLDSLFSTGATGNIVKDAMARKTAGQVPYLQGMKAILTGEPVGEWHVTIGNPLNPIAMIGNLICEGIDVEFNEELGPDDFPTEIKITVRLKHAMARDRDAIESVFNRGMGRIYSLPESFLGSADMQTRVDQATQVRTQTGTAPNPRYAIIATQGQTGRNLVGAQGTANVLGGTVSVWNRGKFSVGLTDNQTLTEGQVTDVYRSAYRAANWIAMKSLV